MINLDTLVEVIQELNPEALYLKPRELYDPCIVGITNNPRDKWDRKTKTWVLVYDTKKCVEAIARNILDDGEEIPDYETYQAAVEWFEFNTSSAWVGESTPAFRCAGWEE